MRGSPRTGLWRVCSGTDAIWPSEVRVDSGAASVGSHRTLACLDCTPCLCRLRSLSQKVMLELNRRAGVSPIRALEKDRACGCRHAPDSSAFRLGCAGLPRSISNCGRRLRGVKAARVDSHRTLACLDWTVGGDRANPLAERRPAVRARGSRCHPQDPGCCPCRNRRPSQRQPAERPEEAPSCRAPGQGWCRSRNRR